MKSLLKKRENIVLLLLIAILIILLFALHDFKSRHANQLTQHEQLEDCSETATKTSRTLEQESSDFSSSPRLPRAQVLFHKEMLIL